MVYSTAEFPMGFIERPSCTKVSEAPCRCRPSVFPEQLRSLPEFVQPAVEPLAYGALTQAQGPQTPRDMCEIMSALFFERSH